MLQRHAIQEFHGNEGMAVVFADFVDRANVWMIECRGSTGLATEALQRLRLIGHVVGQEFEGDETAEFGVFGLVNDAHAAAAKLFEDAVMRDGSADNLIALQRGCLM